MSDLKLVNVHKSFGDRKVCEGINLTVRDGEMVCLIGSSGSGKSTLLRCMNLLEEIDEGEIFLDGIDISAPGLDPQPIRQQIGIVFQSFNLFPHMTAAENVMLAPRRTLDPELVAEVLDVLRQLHAQGMTMVLATHEMNFARELADKVCFLDGGRILEEGTPQAIFSNPQEARTQAFLQSIL